MTAGPAASRRVLARTPVAPLPASGPTRPTGINGRTSAPPEMYLPEVWQVSVAKSVQFSVAIDTRRCCFRSRGLQSSRKTSAPYTRRSSWKVGYIAARSSRKRHGVG